MELLNRIDPEHGLGFKALIIKPGDSIGQYDYVSQFDQDFIWPRSGWVTSTCISHPLKQPHDNTYHPYSFKKCRCGIYQAYSLAIALPYKNKGDFAGAVLLTQPYGLTNYGDNAFKSISAQVVAVVEYRDKQASISTVRASEYFDLPVVTHSVAELAVDIQMLAIAGLYDLKWWEPQNYSVEELRAYVHGFKEVLNAGNLG